MTCVYCKPQAKCHCEPGHWPNDQRCPVHGRDGAEHLKDWWGLSRATWLTMPRVLIEAMPEDWQGRMAGLLREYGEAFPNQPSLGTTVRTTQDGRLVKCPDWLLNYRHPNAAEIAKCRGEK